MAGKLYIHPAREMRILTEGNVNRAQGALIIPHLKEKRPEIVPLIKEDLALVRSLPLAFDQAALFSGMKRLEVGGIRLARALAQHSFIGSGPGLASAWG